MALTIDELKILIQSDEHRQLELKKTMGELKDGMHAACAFLNTEGGWLFFGIAPTSLKILGQQVTDNTQREIALTLTDFTLHFSCCFTKLLHSHFMSLLNPFTKQEKCC